MKKLSLLGAAGAFFLLSFPPTDASVYSSGESDYEPRESLWGRSTPFSPQQEDNKARCAFFGVLNSPDSKRAGAMHSSIHSYLNNGQYKNARDFCQFFIDDPFSGDLLKAQSLLYLANMDNNGNGLPEEQPDYSRARTRYKEALACRALPNTYKAQALFLLANMNYNGWGLPGGQSDYPRARQGYEEALSSELLPEPHHAQALFYLGTLDEDGKGLPEGKPDRARARGRYEAALKFGFLSDKLKAQCLAFLEKMDRGREGLTA